MKFQEIVDQKEKELMDENFRDLYSNLRRSDYQEKINNYCSKYGYNQSEVEDLIKSNQMFAAFFIKEPTKQNFTEKLVAELLGTKTLPQQGKNCIRFNQDGDIVNTRTPDTSKSADFCLGGTYITQKYTRGRGGAQDNQYNDVVDFLTKGSLKHRVAALVDGDFWDERRKDLKFYFKNNENVSIVSMDDILSGVISFE